MKDIRWMLPDGVEEVLPPQAHGMEMLRRRLVDLMHGWGFDLAIPPLVEYLDGLLTGAGSDLDPQTVQYTDRISGRQLGIRADMTPQVARMDAHQIKRDGVSRLCYLGPVLRVEPTRAGASRNPLQLGAEIYGHSGRESEVEIVLLMLEVMHTAGVEGVLIDVGHVGIFRSLARLAGLDENDEGVLFDMMQRKAMPDIEQFIAGRDLPASVADALRALPRLNGDNDVLARAREIIGGVDARLDAQLDELDTFVRLLKGSRPELLMHIDLAELRGYAYHTGVVFAAFASGVGQEIARGGRYDHVGEFFGRARPAIGFSTDLKTLANLGVGAVDDGAGAGGILAPWGTDTALNETIAQLRQAGERVMTQLDEGETPECCDRELILEDGVWRVRPR